MCHMKKRVLLCLLLPLPLLCSCGDGVLESSPSEESGLSSSDFSSMEESSSSESSSSFEDPENKKAAVMAFMEELSSYQDAPTHRVFSGTVLTKYGTGTGEFIEISASKTGEETLYTESPVGTILVSEGTETIGEESSAFLSERYVKDDILYEITRYDSGEGSKQKVAVTAENKARYFDLSFVSEQILLLSSYLPFVMNPQWETSFSFPALSGDGDYEMSYEAILYTEGLPDQRISYSYSFRVEGESVVLSVGRLENVLYLLGEPHQMQCSDIERSYKTKENGAFVGEILDPDDYPLN